MLLTIILSLAASSWAQAPAACDEFLPAAKKGDAAAQVRLGECLERPQPHGNLTPPPSTAGLKWYLAAAAQGDAAAQMRAAVDLYLREDYLRARGWFEKAAAAKNARADGWLGGLYDDGSPALKAFPRDLARAVTYYRAGAALGDAQCMFQLGQHYRSGSGVAKDEKVGRGWIEKAAENGDCSAILMLGAEFAMPEAERRKWGRKSYDNRCIVGA